MTAVDLAGKTIIVRGASSGIGAATARLLRQAGALPVLAARREDRLKELSAELDDAITATEFAGGRFQLGAQPWPGAVVHSPEYVGRVILRALRTGEERIDIPHGPEQPGF